jgi:ribulose-bisphosphate carboxylase small chain
MMRLTQGCFSFLPNFGDDEICEQVQYMLDQKWAVGVEHTGDPHPRHTYWHLWVEPMFDIPDANIIKEEVNDCAEVFPNDYVRVVGFSDQPDYETLMMSFIGHRPLDESPFHIHRIEFSSRAQKYGWA